MEKLIVNATFENYIYKSEDSLFKVIETITKENKKLIIIGNFPQLDEGLMYEFVGTMKTHPKYGEELQCESYSMSKEHSKEGLVSYLSSEKFVGIGPKIALKIVNVLGVDCIDLIIKDKSVLDEVDGLSKAKKDLLYETLKANHYNEQVFVRLYSFGLSSKMIYKIYDVYQENSANIIEENPYILLTEVDGFGFKKCDNIAMNLGFPKDDIRRIKAAIKYTLNYVCFQQGFTYLTKEQLLNSSNKLLGLDAIDNLVDNAIDSLADEKIIAFDNDRYFDFTLLNAENDTADSLNQLYEAKYKAFNKDKIKEKVSYIEKTINIKYTALQKEAIINSLSNKLSIITGGPGTGKSTVLRGILMAYAELNNISMSDDLFTQKVLLVSPTGRASKRMSETTNFKASTIHKALGYNYDGSFMHNEFAKLNCSLIIIDEASMLDINLASALFKSLKVTCQVILVGDANQLPSVGPGNVLNDLIASSIFETTRLNQIMRQASDSAIINLSSMVLNEKINYKIFSLKKEVFFYDCDTKSFKELLFRILDNYILNGGDLQNDLQILIPMYAGIAGIDAVNTAIQERYNKENDVILKREDLLFKKNDKVLQLKNDPTLDIMNGDIGQIVDITKIDGKDALLINFDGKVVTYYASNIDNLKLAYAISIHKAQGSEFNNVIMPILPSYQIMLKKKIIYTGMTRAKKKLIILGKIESLTNSIRNQEYVRQTALLEKLSVDKKAKLQRLFDPDIPFEYFGEYDMEGITPYSFMK